MTTPIDTEAIRSLAAILVDTGLTEIEVEGKEGRIRVVRAAVGPSQSATTMMPMKAAVGSQSATASLAEVPGDEADIAVHPGAILSPMVGIAYLSPEPGAPPFVTAGQLVTAGQTLLLIEAMKTFNQIKAPKAGTVTRILVASGTPVEYGEPLLVLE
jgi:acetyl-CoA carboxylase biotin carboxyl carrier protein